MEKINAVSVIEMANSDIIRVISFTDNEEGNTEAKNLFRSMLPPPPRGPDLKDVEFFIDEGYWEQGSYQLFLTHSS